MGRLTTHVLDLASGRPAEGVRIELNRLDPSPIIAATAVTNADGRIEAPLLEGEAFLTGTYELRFHAGDYFRSRGAAADPTFLDIIVIRFGASGDEHYHVPLLLSPFGYSTYRGS